MGIGNNIPGGQRRLGATNTSEQLISDGSATGGAGFTIKAFSTNVAPIFLGKRETRNETGFELVAGESVSLDVLNGGLLYVSGTREDKICWIGVMA